MLLSLPSLRDALERRDFLLSRIDLPTRMLSVLLLPAVDLRMADSWEPEVEGVLLVIDLDLREVRLFDLPMIDTLPELAAGCLVPVPIEPPMRDLDALVLELDLLPELATGCLADEETDGLCMRIVLGFREVLPELVRLLDPAVDRFADAEADELLALIVPPMRDLDMVVLELERLPELVDGCLDKEADGLCIRIVLLLLEVLPELVRPLDPADERLADAGTDGLLEVIVLPILDLVLVVGCLVEEETDGLLIVIDLPIRALLLGLSRMLELLPTETEPFELRLTEVLDEDLPEVEELGRLEMMIRLEVVPVDLLLEDTELGRPGVERLTVILLEPLRLGSDRLDEIELERFGEDLLTVILRELLRPDRLDEIDPVRLGVDLLTDILLELLRLGADRLTEDLIELLRLGTDRLEVIVLERLELGALLIDVLLELLLLEIDLLGLLRLADIDLERLGVGARLTDGLLRVGAGARLGAADFAA